MSDRTVKLDGHTLTIDEIVMVARHGAKVELSADARRHEADGYGLLLEAAAEGMPVYWFNRGAAINARPSCSRVIRCRRRTIS